MGARVWLASMLAGTIVVMLVGARPEPAPPVSVSKPAERPWLSREAAAQVVEHDGALGPLFRGVVFGAPVPSDVQARIEQFERDHGVELDFELVDGDLATIRFAVTYGGCCGYEGADWFANRIGRQSTGRCCMCGPDTYIDDWAVVSEGGVHMRARVRVNRVELRWETTLDADAILERADALLGADRDAIARAADDRWHEIVPGSHYYLEVPMPAQMRGDWGSPPKIDHRDDLGIHVEAHAGNIIGLTFQLWDAQYRSEIHFSDEDTAQATKRQERRLRSRWGRPRVDENGWTWRLRDRVVTATRYPHPMITIRAR